MTADLTPLERKYIAAASAGDIAETQRLEILVDQAATELEERLSEASSLAAFALEYAAQGLPVFPCIPGAKRPATKHGFHDASADADQIRSWWDRWPAANIGLPTGAQFDCIDVDGRVGHESLALLTALPEIIGQTLTPRGTHLYIHPTGRGNRAALVPGIDYRGAGGYVVAPPSRLSDGGVYRWYEQLKLPEHGEK